MKSVRWIKMDVDMYKNEKLCRVRETLGNEGCYFWAVLLMIAGKSNQGGKLMVSSEVPYTIASLARDAVVPRRLANRAIPLFLRLDMLCRQDGVWVIRDWENHQNLKQMEKLREQATLRQRRHRQKEKENEKFQNDFGENFE